MKTKTQIPFKCKLSNLKRFKFASIYGLFLIYFSFSVNAQNKIDTKKFSPDTFTISESDFKNILKSKSGTTYHSKNEILNNSFVSLNNVVNQNQQVKMELKTIKNANLIIQVNGNDSKQVFILGKDEVFYNGVFSEEKIIMKRCQKDDLFVE